MKHSSRKIIHIDCDCFFAAVEIRDNPSLQGKPVAVGGSASRRGVLSTCNYEARLFGLHSAMPTAEALRRCPELILLPHRFDAYKKASSEVQAIFLQYTDTIEPLSLDEAYLDVSGMQDASAAARHIRQEIAKKVGITASAGISVNKFLAKVASDWQKPNGQFVIKPHQVKPFIDALPVKKIPGVGAATMEKMQRLNIQTCADLQQFELYQLMQQFGAFGKRLYEYARGIDHRAVKSLREKKSLSVEQTFDTDLFQQSQIEQALQHNFRDLLQRIEPVMGQYQIHKLVLKLRLKDFSTHTAELQGAVVDIALYQQLLAGLLAKYPGAIRLLGLGVGLKPKELRQLDLFEHYR